MFYIGLTKTKILTLKIKSKTGATTVIIDTLRFEPTADSHTRTAQQSNCTSSWRHPPHLTRPFQSYFKETLIHIKSSWNAESGHITHNLFKHYDNFVLWQFLY